MNGHLTDEEKVQYLRTIFDTIPLPTFIVDEEVRIEDFNTAAESFLGPDAPLALHRRGGEAFHCLNSNLNGCGNSESCRDCMLRTCVQRAIHGRATHQEMYQAELVTPQGPRLIDLLITATLLPYTESPRVLLILEDVTEITSLRGQVSGSETTRTGTS
jgi:PAS domain-containing protein